jgi:methionyl-tRNA formyltransferase
LDGLAENAIEEKPQPQVEHPKNAYKILKKIPESIGSTFKTVHQFI